MTETPEDAPPSLSVNPRTAGEFDAFYAGTAPWDIGRSRFVGSLRAAAAAGGRYYLLCFTDQQPGDWGPRRCARLAGDDHPDVMSVAPGRPAP